MCCCDLCLHCTAEITLRPCHYSCPNLNGSFVIFDALDLSVHFRGDPCFAETLHLSESSIRGYDHDTCKEHRSRLAEPHQIWMDVGFMWAIKEIQKLCFLTRSCHMGACVHRRAHPRMRVIRVSRTAASTCNECKRQKEVQSHRHLSSCRDTEQDM